VFYDTESNRILIGIAYICNRSPLDLYHWSWTTVQGRQRAIPLWQL